MILLSYGIFALIEIKLSGKENGISLPQFKIILTRGEFGCIRKDEVMVIAIGCLCMLIIVNNI